MSRTLTERTLVARINRKLAHDRQALCKPRGARATLDLGEYYVRDYGFKIATHTYVDPESFRRELGVLTDDEAVQP
jgi:hypothetical protein